MKAKAIVFIMATMFITSCTTKPKEFYFITDKGKTISIDTCFSIQKELKVEGLTDTLNYFSIYSINTGYVIVNRKKPYLLYLDQDGRLNKKVKYEIDWIKEIKEQYPQGVPDKLMPIILTCADINSNIYIYTDENKGIHVYNSSGDLINKIPVKDPYKIRHICVNKDGLIFTHKAPSEKSPFYVDVYDAGGYKKSLIRGDEMYSAYYYRGFLEGGLLALENGDVIETNLFIRGMHIISTDLKTTYIDTKEPDFIKLKEARNIRTSIDTLEANWRKIKLSFSFSNLGDNKHIIRKAFTFPDEYSSERKVYYEIFDFKGNFVKSEQYKGYLLWEFERSNKLLFYSEAPESRYSKNMIRFIRIYKYEF